MYTLHTHTHINHNMNKSIISIYCKVWSNNNWFRSIHSKLITWIFVNEWFAVPVALSMKISAMFPKKMPILVELQDMPEVEPITHTRRAHTHTYLWRHRRIHPHCSSSRVKADHSFRTDVQLLAHVPLGGHPSEFLWRELCWSRYPLECHHRNSTMLSQYPSRKCPKFGLTTGRCRSEPIGCLINRQHVHADVASVFSLWLCLASLGEAH